MEKTELLTQLRIDRSSPAPSSSRVYWIIGVLALVLLIAGAWLWTARVAPTLVQVAAAVKPSQSVSASVLDATGYVTARRQATVSAKITGKVRDVLIEEGMRVEQDQVLATLDDTEARAQLALSEAQLASARSQLVELRVQLAQAEREHRRQGEMAQKKLVSTAALEQAASQVDALAARLQSSVSQVGVAEEGVAMARVQVDNTIVRAPFAGVVIAKAAQPGEMISPISAGGGFTRTGIGTLVDMDSLEIQVDVNESFINRVQAKQPVVATLNAYPDWRIAAEVIAIIPTADRNKATVRVRIAVLERDTRILPDMGVRVAFLEESEKATAKSEAAPSFLLIPQAAVSGEGADAKVFVFSDGRALRRSIRVGAGVGDSRQVLDGLREGERVVVTPPASLKDGDAVRIADNG